MERPREAETLDRASASRAAADKLAPPADYHPLSDGNIETAAGTRLETPEQRDLYKYPEAAAHGRATELQGTLGENQRGRVTMAAGVLEGANGERQLVVGTSEHTSSGKAYVRPEVAERLNPDRDIVVPGKGHAEANIVAWAKENDHKVVAIGAGRPECQECVQAIEGAGGVVASPKNEVSEVRDDERQ